MSDENIKPHATSNNSFAPSSNCISTKIRVKFYGCCLNCTRKLFLGCVKLTWNTADFDKYKYFEFGIRFDARGRFSLSVVSLVKAQ